MNLSMDVKQNSLSVAKIPSKESIKVSSYQFGLMRGRHCLYKWTILNPVSCFHDSMLVVIVDGMVPFIFLDSFCKE
jgi:hypothetical protein